jgi:hypothetical protein
LILWGGVERNGPRFPKNWKIKEINIRLKIGTNLCSHGKVNRSWDRLTNRRWFSHCINGFWKLV